MVRFLVLTEDASEGAHATVAALARKLLQLVVPACQTHKLAFEPPDQDAKLVACGNRWRSRKLSDHKQIVDLRRSIANKLAERRGFVLFHVDGDTCWSKRTKSKNRAQFDDLIRDKVRALLQMRRPPRPPLSEDEIDRRMANLHLLMPFYSIEAWTYQNLDRAIQLCRERHNGQHVETFEQWRANRALIDEHDKPKDTLCLGSRHNKDLATRAYPANDAYAADTSFAAAANALLECDELCTALQETCT